MSDKTEDRNDMLAGAPQEFCIPINTILMNLETILSEPVNDNVKNSVVEIRWAAEQIVSLLQQGGCSENAAAAECADRPLSAEMLERLKTGRICREDLKHIITKLIVSLENYQIEAAEELFYRLAQCIYGDEDIEDHLHGAEVYMLSYDYQGVIDELTKIWEQL